MGRVLGPHARTDRTRDIRVAEPWLPAPEDGRPGEGQRLTPDAPHNGGRQLPGDPLLPVPQRAMPTRKGARCCAAAPSPRPHRPHPGHTGRITPAARPRGRAAGRGTAPDTRRLSQRWQATPPGTAPHHPRGTQPPQGMQATGTVLGPHTLTPVTTACGWRTPTARPVGGQFGKGERLTTDAPHNGGRPPPSGMPFRQGQRCSLWGRCWVPTPAPTAPKTHGSRNPGCPPQRTGGRGGERA